MPGTGADLAHGAWRHAPHLRTATLPVVTASNSYMRVRASALPVSASVNGTIGDWRIYLAWMSGSSASRLNQWRADMKDEYIVRIEHFLQSLDISNYRFERRTKHRSVIVEYQGRTRFVIFPSTGSDCNGPSRVISHLRHTLGLFQNSANNNETENDVKRRRVRTYHSAPRSSRARLTIDPPLSPPDRFYTPLMTIRGRLVAAEAAAATTVEPDDLNHSRVW